MADWEDAPSSSGGWEEAPRGKPLPANAGIAKLATSVLGLPVDTIENVINLGIAGVGTAATAAGRPDLAPDLLRGSIGGSESLQRGLRATGMPGLSPDNPTPDSPVGKAQYDFVARGGVLPGGALPAAGSMIAEKIGGPEWAGVGSLAPSPAISAYNALRAPGLEKAKTHNAVRDVTLKEGQELGFVAPPSQTNPTFLGNRLESLAGKAATNQSATIKNEAVFDDVARRAAGLQKGAPITVKALEARRDVLAEPYRQVGALSPVAKQALEKLRDARSEANAYWRHWDMQGVPESQRLAKKFDNDATVLERVIQKEALRAGRPDLLAELRSARTAIAKTFDIERALNVGTGHVDGHILGKALDRGRPLTGELATAAKFAEAFPNVTIPSAGMSPGVSKVEGGLAALLATGGLASLGPAGIALGALPLASHPARSVVLSGPYQRAFARPSYEPGMLPENNIQSIARLAAMENQRGRP